MNISAYILEYLKQFGTVTVPSFGVFSLENSKAIINSENGSILPPSSQITFKPDYKVESDELVAFISNQKQVTLESAKNELQVQTDFWKKKLQADQNLEIQNLGIIFVENGQAHFKGNRLQSDHPDFYGLEEIRISDINNVDSSAVSEKLGEEYKFNKSILWIFLFIIPVLGILYFTITQPELLFGKKSFNTQPQVKSKAEKRVKDTIKVKTDSAQMKILDSLRKDSLIKSTVKGSENHAAKNINTKTTWQK